MRFIVLSILALALTSCASKTKWAIDGQSEIAFTSGKITAIPQISKEEMDNFEFVTLELKISNTSDKQIDIDPADIIVLTTEGQVVNQMSRDELLSLSKTRSNVSSSVGVGFGGFNRFGFGTSIGQNRQAENELMEFFDGNSLKKGPIPAGAFKQGMMFFAVPKKSSEKITFKFERTLASKEQITIQKQK